MASHVSSYLFQQVLDVGCFLVEPRDRFFVQATVHVGVLHRARLVVWGISLGLVLRDSGLSMNDWQ